MKDIIVHTVPRGQVLNKEGDPRHILLLWTAHVRNISPQYWRPRFPHRSVVSSSQNTKNCGSTHKFAFKELMATVVQVQSVSGQYSNTEPENNYSRKLTNTGQPLPDLGQPCVHLPARSCTRATLRTHRAACRSDISPWSPLFTPGFKAVSTMFSSPPHPWSPEAILFSAKRLSAEGCFMTEQKAMPEWGKCKGGSHRLMETNTIRSPSLPFFRRQHGILYSKPFIEPNNLCSTCSKQLKPDLSTFEGWAWLVVGAYGKKMWLIPWLLVLQIMSEHLWKTGVNQTQVIWLNSKPGEVLHSLYCTGWPNRQDNLTLPHLTLQIPPAYPMTKAATN